MYRLLAMDMDRTLLLGDGTLPEVVRNRLRALNDYGVEIALCTGRVTRSARHYAREIGGASTVSFNGSSVMMGDSIISDSSIDVPTMERVIGFCKEKGIYVQYYRGDTIIVERSTPELETDHDVRFSGFEEVGDLCKAEILAPTPKMVALKMSDDVDACLEEFADTFPELTFSHSSRHVIEIMPKGVDKGTGLMAVADRLGIGREETVAIGDGMNDLPMIRWAGMGVAVANADPELKRSADSVTGNEMSFGVLEAINGFFPHS